MSGEEIPPSVREQVKAAQELETALGIRHAYDERGRPRIGILVLTGGFTAVLVLFAVFVNWLWWIPAGIFLFALVMMLFTYLMIRRLRAREEKKGV